MGRFWAVGVGPGDPELLTVKAVRLVRSAHVLYHAGPAPHEGRAWDVVRHLHQPGQEVRTVRSAPMADIDGSAEAYREGAERIAADCRAGRDVVFVTEGDPTLYSTATPVWELVGRLCPDVAVEVVP